MSHQVQAQLPDEDGLCQTVFSGNIGQKIFSYLGRQETGRMLHINRAINNISQNSAFWFNIAERLQIDLKQLHINFNKPLKLNDQEYIAYQKGYVKDYCQPRVTVLFDANADSLHSKNCRFTNIELSQFSSYSSVIVGHAFYKQIGKQIAVIWKDGIIIPLGLLNNGQGSSATAVSADGNIVVGRAYDGQNKNKQTAVMWDKEGIPSPLNNGEDSSTRAISNNGKIIVG